ncbi:MAG: zinc metallopeptidase [Culicoidibacterales bacterium]
MYFYNFSPEYIMIMIITVVITGFASMRVRSAYAKFSKVETVGGLTGYDTARKILDANGLDKVQVVPVQGKLSDHYDPGRKVVRLSEEIFYGRSIASVSVAAHEVGHALQDANAYAFLKFRTALVPVVNFSTNASWGLIMLGLLFGFTELAYIGVILFGAGFLFQVVTLPVEFNASSRALEQLSQFGIVTSSELKGAQNMLSAAALTYVAAALSSLLYFLYLLSSVRRND